MIYFKEMCTKFETENTRQDRKKTVTDSYHKSLNQLQKYRLPYIYMEKKILDYRTLSELFE